MLRYPGKVGIVGPDQVLVMRCEQAAAVAELDTLSGLRDAATICVMSDALLRVSECTVLEVHIVRFEDHRTNRTAHNTSFQDGSGRGRSGALPCAPTVKRLSDRKKAAAIKDGPLSRRIRGGGHVQSDRLTPRAILVIMNTKTQAAIIDGRIAGTRIV